PQGAPGGTAALPPGAEARAPDHLAPPQRELRRHRPELPRPGPPPGDDLVDRGRRRLEPARRGDDRRHRLERHRADPEARGHRLQAHRHLARQGRLRAAPPRVLRRRDRPEEAHHADQDRQRGRDSGAARHRGGEPRRGQPHRDRDHGRPLQPGPQGRPVQPALPRAGRALSPAPATSTRLAGAAVVALFAALILLPNLGGYALWDPDEGRHAEVAREMLAAHDWRGWIVPTYGFRPYHDKPVLFYWA